MFLYQLLGLLFLFILALLAKVFLIPFIRYQILKSRLSDLPKSSKYAIPNVVKFTEIGGPDKALEILLDNNGKPYPMFNFGPEMDGTPILQVCSPDGIREVLLHDDVFHKNYAHTVSEILGQGLVLSEDALWKRERRLLTPLFHFAALKQMIPIIMEEANHFVDDLAKRNGEPVEAKLFSNLTLRVIVKVAFGGDFDAEWMAQQWHEVLTNMGPHIVGKMSLGPLTSLSPWTIRLLRHIKAIDNKALELIQKRRNNKEQKSDLIGSMLSARDEDGTGIDDKQILDEVRTFLFAGHDTTSNLLSWCMYYIGKHGDVQQKLIDEIDSVLSHHLPTENDLPKLKYCKQTLEETLRLRPALMDTGRIAMKDTTLLGRHIPKGSYISVNFCAVHYHPDFWKNPKDFIPERFSDEAKQEKRHPFAYVPFSGGPRNCIGSKLAMQEATIVLCRILQRFRVSVENSEEVQPFYEGTVTPHGLKLRYLPR